MTKQNKFSVGDRVRVYFSGMYGEGRSYVATVGEINASEMLRVDYPDMPKPPLGYHINWVHPKQCRRLVKKPRKRYWICGYINGAIVAYDSKEGAESSVSLHRTKWMHEFVEVRKGKKG